MVPFGQIKTKITYYKNLLASVPQPPYTGFFDFLSFVPFVTQITIAPYENFLKKSKFTRIIELFSD